MMAFGLGVLRLSSAEFWQLTLPEFRAATRGVRGELGLAEPLPRSVFTALMQRFPDQIPEGT